MEGDVSSAILLSVSLVFQSTPSAWRETLATPSAIRYCSISIHSLRMEGDNKFCYPYFGRYISIHSLRMEGDYTSGNIPDKRYISIHSLRMEGDPPQNLRLTFQNYFNPLPPHGGRQKAFVSGARTRHFNPLPPHGGRPAISLYVIAISPISIHSLRMEGDCCWCSCWRGLCDFNPLPPHGGRPKRRLFSEYSILFQSTPSAWRETWLLSCSSPAWRNFNPLPPHGGRRHYSQQKRVSRDFNPLPPHGGRPRPTRTIYR